MPTLHVTSPRGKKTSFDESEFEQVRFGRDTSWANIVLDESLAKLGVGREHCELVATAGCFSLEMNERNHVWVDGKKAYDGDLLPKNCILSFAKDTAGACYQLETEVSGGAETAYFGPVERKGTQFKKIVISTVAVLVLVVGYLLFQSQQQSLTEQQVEAIKDRVFSVQTSVNSKISHAGTAWLAGKNIVVTNRHVAMLVQKNLELAEMGVDASAMIRFRSVDNHQGKSKNIKNIIFHPAEAAYQKFLNTHPVRSMTDKSIKLDIYDIAILELEGEPIQLSPLILANEQEAQALTSGDPLLLVGFPLNAAGKNAWDLLKPVAETSYGKFDKTRNAFSSEGIKGINPLISYDMTTSGGNSGSPVINKQGKVVAIHFAGSKLLLEGSKVEGANKAVRLDAGGKSYGQSIRLVNMLVDGSIFEPEVMKKEQALWSQWLATSTSIEMQKVSLKDASSEFKNRCVLNYQSAWDSLEKVNSSMRRSKLKFNLPVKGEYLVFIQSFEPDGKKISISAISEFAASQYHGKKPYFDFEIVSKQENDQLDLTLGGNSRKSDFTVNLFVWSDKPCGISGYKSRVN